MTRRTIRPPVFVAFTQWRDPARDRRAVAIERRRIGRRLAHALLIAGSGCDGWAIEAEPGGRPRARHPTSGKHFALSIAHTGGLIAAAICDGDEIGIDVERRDPDRDHRGIAELAFGRAGRDTVARGGAAAFYRLWTLREAMGKATGEGLAMAAGAADQIGAGPHVGYWISADSRWLLAHLELPSEVSLALAVRSEVSVAADAWMPRRYLWLNNSDGSIVSRLPGMATDRAQRCAV